MQGAVCAIDSDIHLHHAAHAEVNLLLARLMNRPVSTYPGVGLKQPCIAIHDIGEIRRSRFLLAVQQKLEVRGQTNARSLQRVQGHKHGDDR